MREMSGALIGIEQAFHSANSWSLSVVSLFFSQRPFSASLLPGSRIRTIGVLLTENLEKRRNIVRLFRLAEYPMKKPSLLVVFLTVMIDLIGFGIVLPLLPVFSEQFGASGLLIGIIMAAYSAMQFVFAPIWGRVSDRIGRRPVLLASTSVASLSYVVFALGCGLEHQGALWIFLGSRLIAGACGANITVAQAYVADISAPEERSKRMGLIGMAFGLGFIIGPAIGGLGVKWFGMPGPGWAAALLCAINFISASIFLKESWTPQAEHVRARPHGEQWRHTLSHPALALLIAVFFLATICFTCFETTLGLLVNQNFGFDASNPHEAQYIGYLFTFAGLIGAVVQGGLIGRLVNTWGEPRVIAGSMFLVGISLAPLPYIHTWLPLLGAVGILAAGSSMSRPPLFGMISRLTDPHEQGATLGVAQSCGSLGRIIGPIFAGAFYHVHPSLPYLVCAALALLTSLIAWNYLTRHA